MPWGAIIGAMLPFILSMFGGGGDKTSGEMDPAIKKLLLGGMPERGSTGQTGFAGQNADPYGLGMMELQLRQAQRADPLNAGIVNLASQLMPTFQSKTNPTTKLPRSSVLDTGTTGGTDGTTGGVNVNGSFSGVPSSSGFSVPGMDTPNQPPSGPLPIAGALGNNANMFPSYLDLLQQMAAQGRRS